MWFQILLIIYIIGFIIMVWYLKNIYTEYSPLNIGEKLRFLIALIFYPVIWIISLIMAFFQISYLGGDDVDSNYD